MSAPFVRMLADSEDPGARLVLRREVGDLAEVISEQVLPEQVDNPEANHVEVYSQLWLAEPELEWLHRVSGELLGEIRKERE